MVEIAVVLLVIAIIAAFAIPQVLEYLKLYRLGVASRNVATMVQRARFLATSNNTRAGIAIHRNNRIDIEQYDLEGKQPPLNKGFVELPEGIVITSAVPAAVSFDGRGVVTPVPKEPQIIRLKGQKGYSTIVTISFNGQVAVSDAFVESEE
jgi:Tfp pilus assembly protein FimT